MKKVVASQNSQQKRRIVQLSLDVAIPANEDGYSVAEYIANLIDTYSNFETMGQEFIADLTSVYVNEYGENPDDYEIGR